MFLVYTKAAFVSPPSSSASSDLLSHFGANFSINTAPKGAVNTIAITELTRTVLAKVICSSVPPLAKSNAIGPMVACTVALGRLDSVIYARSRHENSPPLVHKYPKSILTARPRTSATTPCHSVSV